ncbi:MAG: glycosyltransferase family 4 protein [Flavobacteriales bacterium]|jgi:glycosyltransferase involved in cell wall biosynthesis|nr:glycosyltransferase family 4 protein [Flavobacteriales bacterium]
MKIVHLNTYDLQGGAAIAANRLHSTLLKHGIDSTMVVDIAKGNTPNCIAISKTPFQQKLQKWTYLFEKILFIPFEASKNKRFAFTTFLFGKNLDKIPEIKEADLIHIHWVNHSFFSKKTFEYIFSLGKPVVITMHDMWFATGGCHHSNECENYQKECGNCKYLKKPHAKDLSNKNWLKKKELFPKNLTFVTCSKWLLSRVEKSSLLKNQNLRSIPNPIDTSIYTDGDKKMAKKQLGLSADKKHILYIAANVGNIQKGYQYLEEACGKMAQDDRFSQIEILVVGADPKNRVHLSLPMIKLGYISKVSELVTIYQASDLFISPTLEDNLPNTIMESMSCGTPCVAFNIGGIPQLIDHKENGYISEYKNANDLINGIEFCLSNHHLNKQARNKVIKSFDQEYIAQEFKSLYKDLLAKTN